MDILSFSRSISQLFFYIVTLYWVVTMKLLLSSGLCGMTPLQGTIVGGSYFIIVGMMQMVFEIGHLRTVKESIKGSTPLPRLCIEYYYSLLGMQGTTLLFSVCLMGAIWAKRPMGILGFAAWLTLYDVALLIVTSLLEVEMQAMKLKLNPLSWYGIACRLVGDPFWLAFVITHGLEVHMEMCPGARKRKVGSLGSAQDGALRLKFKVFDAGV